MINCFCEPRCKAARGMRRQWAGRWGCRWPSSTGAGDGISQWLSEHPAVNTCRPRKAQALGVAVGVWRPQPQSPRLQQQLLGWQRSGAAHPVRGVAAPQAPGVSGRVPDTGHPHGRPQSHRAGSWPRRQLLRLRHQEAPPGTVQMWPCRRPPPSAQPSATLCSGSDFNNGQKSPFLLKLINTKVSCPYTNPTQFLSVSWVYQRILTKLVLGQVRKWDLGWHHPAFPELPNSADTTERVKIGIVNFEMIKYANKLHSFKEITFAPSCLPLSTA